jgi:hypothetical protein
LEDGHGQVMLVGNNHVWTKNTLNSAIHIEATPLEATL